MPPALIFLIEGLAAAMNRFVAPNYSKRCSNKTVQIVAVTETIQSFGDTVQTIGPSVIVRQTQFVDVTDAATN